jgi:hypothetical protein
MTQHADSSSSHTGSADCDEWGDSEAEYALEPSVGTGENNNNNIKNIKKEQALHGTNRQVGGAAVAAGIAGTLLVGPLVGLVVAGGAAVVATTGGSAGKVARASGTVVANTGDRLQKLNQKHQITSKTRKGVVKGAKWISSKLKVKDPHAASHDLTA